MVSDRRWSTGSEVVDGWDADDVEEEEAVVVVETELLRALL